MPLQIEVTAQSRPAVVPCTPHSSKLSQICPTVVADETNCQGAAQRIPLSSRSHWRNSTKY